jgi:hypothetical protein
MVSQRGRMSSRRFRRAVADALALLLVAAMLVALPSTPALAAVDPDDPVDVSVPVTAVVPRRADTPVVTPVRRDPVVWPTAARASVDLPANAVGARTAGAATVGGLPYGWSRCRATAMSSPGASQPGPG